MSDFLRLEVFPKPVFHQKAEEAEFMRCVLDAAENIEPSTQLAACALQLACKYNLATLDSLHAAAAYIGEVDELVTIEKPTKPLCQIQEIKVVTLYPYGTV